MSHPVFTPAAVDPAELESITVGRTELFDSLVRRISLAAQDGSRPHTLLVAARGGGKTHTLHLVVNRSLADPDIASTVLPVWIPEDALAIGCYADLLVEIARAIDPDLTETARGLRREKDIIGLESAILTTAGDRMILLAIENLDRVFDAIGESGQGSLRAWVETSMAITLFASTPMLFAGVSSRSFPWYGSFMVEPLPELTVDETADLLACAARRRGDDALADFVESPTGHHRLQVIHRLAGGSPRLGHILSERVDAQSLDELVPAVEALLDRLAPYYQQRLWQLPASEQRLVAELARGWAPRTVGDLASAVGVSNQSAATALGRLAASRWVSARKSATGDKRASWYDLTEPMLRYQLQYRELRGEPLRLIVEFLREFHDSALSGLGGLSGEPAVVGHSVALAIDRGEVTWADLPEVMAAVGAPDRPSVAAHIAFWTRVAGVDLPGEGGPLDHVDPAAKPAIEHFLAEIDSWKTKSDARARVTATRESPGPASRSPTASCRP